MSVCGTSQSIDAPLCLLGAAPVRFAAASPVEITFAPFLLSGLLLFSTAGFAASEMEELAATMQNADFSVQVERLLRNGRAPQALELAEIGIQRNPRNAQLVFQKAVALETMERTEEAAKVLRSLIADYPEIPEPYNNLAVIEAGLGNLEASVALLQKALVINPEFALARKNLGDVYLALAVENYQAAQPALPNNRVLAQRLRSLERILGK